MTDALTMALEPSEEEKMVREAVRGICSKYGREYAEKKIEAGEPPTELWNELGEAGFLGLNLPEEYGGGGMGMTGLAWVMEELAENANMLLMLVVSPAIAGSIIAKHGTDAQKKEILPDMAAGKIKIAFGITEPDAGSNTHKITTNAVKTEDGTWKLNGQKYYISGVEHATHVLVIARQKMPDGELALPLIFVMPVDADGFTKQHLPTVHPGMDEQWTLFFDDVELDDSALIGGEFGGLPAVFDGLNPERIMGAAGGVGGARLAIDTAVEYASTRKVFRDKPIGTHQAIAHPLAECWVEYEQAKLLLEKACALYDAGHPKAGDFANMAKYAAGEVAVKAADRAIQTHGGNGMSEEYGIAYMWLSARLLQIAPVSREMILNHISQHSLGLPKSY